MSKKRFNCHQIIADYTTGEDIDFDFFQELINEQLQPQDLRMHISDGNKILTYRECVDLLNNLFEENEELKKENEQLERENTATWQENQQIIKEGVIPHQNKIQQLQKENEQLKQSNKDAWDLIQFIYNEIKEDGSMDWGRIQDLVVFE